jgi:hypothetical protein
MFRASGCVSSNSLPAHFLLRELATGVLVIVMSIITYDKCYDMFVQLACTSFGFMRFN